MGSTDEIYLKVEVLYLFSQGSGQADHPHLIQVHYPAHQQAPTLRDVKLRLTALRGSGMSDSYSWSYKRCYRGAFVWCDVVDDDFILPLSESGEYVLKALEVVESPRDALGREAVQPSRVAGTALVNNVPRDMDPIPKLNELCKVDRPKETSTDWSEWKQVPVNGPAVSDTATNACRIEPSDVSRSRSSSFVPELFIENKRCLESTKETDSSTDDFSTDASCELSSEEDSHVESKEMPASAVMQSTNHGGILSFPLPSLEVSRKECVKSETWVVEEEVNPTPVKGRTSRRSNDEFYDCSSTACIGDIPSSPVTQACFPGYAFTFMLKKTARFPRSQICRRVEVVERLQAVTVEKPIYSRYIPSTRHGSGSTMEPRLPHSTKTGTLNWRLQRKQRPAVEPGREVRSLSKFLEDTKNQTILQVIDKEDISRIRRAPRVRKVRNDDCDYAMCREVALDVPEALVQSGRGLGKNEKIVSDLSLKKTDLKSSRVLTRPAARQSFRLGAKQSSASFSPASGNVLNPSAFSGPLDTSKEKAYKHRRALIAGISGSHITSDEAYIARPLTSGLT
ncbi:protein SOSEKI 2-like isoform X2 [Physcomitrium patens]|uniref:SOSEKI DIX-like domain-containing protein n=1 Tax=Physcomitrium patens TaxID=3218 RepID=A0A7I4BSN3_PHYPA|nr:uncharacterized protein LOC112280952 isoform X2 [Physcomitrium patens]|eukprot:XP_024372716.1 uncharacterized protein LOC112280952 isoform X2 [Physcomitrella patens]